MATAQRVGFPPGRSGNSTTTVSAITYPSPQFPYTHSVSRIAPAPRAGVRISGEANIVSAPTTRPTTPHGNPRPTRCPNRNLSRYRCCSENKYTPPPPPLFSVLERPPPSPPKGNQPNSATRPALSLPSEHMAKKAQVGGPTPLKTPPPSPPKVTVPGSGRPARPKSGCPTLP